MKRILNTGMMLLIIIFLSCQKKFTPSSDGLGKPVSYDTATFDYLYVEAVKQKLLGNMGDALHLLEQCVKINPGSDAAWFQMAQIVIGLGEETTGKKYALKAYSLDPGNFWYMMILAGTYYKENNLDSAVIYYEKAGEKFPDREDLQLTLGNIYSENKKYDKASKIFGNLDSKYGINEASTTSEIKNQIRAGNYDEAEKKALLLVEQFPDKGIYQALLAEIYRAKGEDGRAMEIYKKLMARQPDNPETLLSLCDFLISDKKYSELSDVLNNVVINTEISRENKIALFAQLIEIPEFIKEYGDKLQITMMVLESEFPKDDIILLLRPEVLTAQGKLKAAADRLEELIALNPGNYYAWEKLLLVYYDQGNFAMLEKRGEECATDFNRSFLAKLLYATALSENKKYGKALEELEKANILAGDNKEMLLQVLTLKADVFYREKDFNHAFSTFDEALKINNNDLTVLNNYAYYLAQQNSKLKEAEEMAKKVITEEGKNTTFLDTYAWVLYKRGKLREAEKIMESVINSGEKRDAEWYEHYGYILKKRRDCQAAVKNWKIALEIDSTKTELLKEVEKCQGGH